MSMTSKEFRTELVKIMPGYDWTVHKPSTASRIEATGTKSSGSNRLSTLWVIRTERNGSAWYEVKSSGFGLRSPWLGTESDKTLARALRCLQSHYEERAAIYSGHANALQSARAKSEART